MRHHRKLTDDERRQIIEARAAGSPATAVAHRFGVSTRTIYYTLSKAEGPHPAQTKTISTRVSERQLAGFMAALAARGIADRPSALRRLIGAADEILTPADQAMLDKLRGWGADIRTSGGAINQIARKLNEAKLRGRPMPYTAEDAATVRAVAVSLFDFIEEFRALWDTKRAAMTGEVDKALAGLAIQAPDP